MAHRRDGPTPRVAFPQDLSPEARIAILRGGALGDFLCTTAALSALRASLPNAAITLITSPIVAPLARRYDAIDRIIVGPAYHGVFPGAQDDDTLADFFEAMRLEQFDLAFQWHGGGRYSNGFVRRLGAKHTVGFKSDDAPPLDRWLPYDARQHELLRYLDLLRLLGIDCAATRPYLPVLPSDRDELATLGDLVDLEALRKGRYMGLHAGASVASRKWLPERYAIVLDRLLEEFDFDGVLVTAGPGQREDSAAVIARMDRADQTVDLGGQTSLEALIALIEQLGFFLTNDSAPSHIAMALDVPSLVVFGSAHPVNWAPLERTFHRLVANWDAPCRWIMEDGCPDSSHVPCLEGVQPEAVLAEARQLLRMMGRTRGTASSRRARSAA